MNQKSLMSLSFKKKKNSLQYIFLLGYLQRKLDKQILKKNKIFSDNA